MDENDEYNAQNYQLENLKEMIKDTSLAKAVGNEAAVRLLLKYRDHLEECVDSLLKHMENRDMMGIRDIAHSLKGSGKSYGFDFVTEIGLLLSSSAKKQNIKELTELIEELGKWVKDSFFANII
ncbi:Hpt domain-containing protein [Thermodesulfobacteriota bacterium]